ncbi:FAD-dependent monooxygenase [Streptomyces sp. SS7]|uniref:FAD-dependent monooxygenase n=1 Tax=Streptomyces sp. SS7 TaxID=3108485 RepID=UPI0030EE6EE6
MAEHKHGPRVAIVGAGITGLTLAAALDRSGVTCEVFERAPGLGETGAGIQLGPNAVRLLHRLGLADDLAKTAVPSAGIELRSWERGEVIGRIPLGDRCEERFGVPYYLLRRSDLHAALLRLLPAGTVRPGKACVAVDEHADGAELRFLDGTAVEADLVVGADGIRSVVRGCLTRDEPVYSGQTVYRGLAPADRTPFPAGEWASLIWAGPGQHFVCYPVAGGELVNFVATVPSGRQPTESWSEPGEIRDVLEAYTGWDPTVLGIVEATDTVTRWALHVRESDFAWSRQRITLAGDAAHPMLPFMAQGASQGIEDAFALAACLRDAERSGIPAALQRYEAARRPRTVLVQQRSNDMIRVFHDPDAPRPAPEHGDLLDTVSWLFGHDAEQVPTT